MCVCVCVCFSTSCQHTYSSSMLVKFLSKSLGIEARLFFSMSLFSQEASSSFRPPCPLSLSSTAHEERKRDAWNRITKQSFPLYVSSSSSSSFLTLLLYRNAISRDGRRSMALVVCSFVRSFVRSDLQFYQLAQGVKDARCQRFQLVVREASV